MAFYRILMGAACNALVFNASAQAQPTELSELVVTASGFEQKQSAAPASVTVISGEEIRSKQAFSPTDILDDVTPNGFGQTATSFLPPPAAIERIEVVRGPMSTLYGSDAMGGVITIITRKVGSEWSSSLTAETTLDEDSDFGDSRTYPEYPLERTTRLRQKTK